MICYVCLIITDESKHVDKIEVTSRDTLNTVSSYVIIIASF